MLVFLGGVVLFFAVLYVLLYRLLIIPGAKVQKDLFAQKVVARIHAVVDGEQNRLATIAKDWSNWDAMVAYVRRPNAGFERESLPAGVLSDIDMDLLAIEDAAGKRVFFTNRRGPQGVPASFREVEDRQEPLWGLLAERADPSLRRWLVASWNGPWLLVSAPILGSDGKPPARGRLIFGRRIDSAFGTRIAQVLSESCRLDCSRGRPFQAPRAAPPSGISPYRLSERTGRLVITTGMRDSFGNEAFQVTVTTDTRIFHILERAVKLSFFLLIGITLLFAVGATWSIQHAVIRRIVGIAGTMERIVSFENLTVRVPEAGRDEVGELARHVNRMLERLECETRQSRKIQDLLAANERMAAIGRLATNIAHEINNPLFAIANTVQVMKRELPEGGEAVLLAEREISRVRRITGELLDFARLRGEDYAEVDPAEIVQAAIQVLTWSHQLRETEVVLSTSVGPPVYGNPDGLQQVFMNLLQNAAKASPPGGRVTVTITASPEWVEISFSDQGPGFAESARAHLFEPFNSPHPGQGNGLGLYVSYQIVQQHRGEMLLCEAEGGGSRMVVRLPHYRGER